MEAVLEIGEAVWMKKIVLLFIAVIILYCSAGCRKAPADNAKNTAIEFLKAMYTFQDNDKVLDGDDLVRLQDVFNEKLHPYMTEDGYQKMRGSRVGYLTLSVGVYSKSRVSLDGVDIKILEEDKENKTTVYDYTAKVKLAPVDGSQPKTMDIKGQLVLSLQKDGWKVTSSQLVGGNRDWLNIAMGRNK